MFECAAVFRLIPERYEIFWQSGERDIVWAWLFWRIVKKFAV